MFANQAGAAPDEASLDVQVGTTSRIVKVS
jgi:hypothetical protein